jgi:hypothetical protein
VASPEGYLNQKRFKLRKAPGEWQTQCPFCGDTNKYGHLYVNREHGAFYCHRCGEKGSFWDLQVKLGDQPERATRESALKDVVWRAAVSICQDALVENKEAMNYLRGNTRGLKPSTIGKYRLGWVPGDLTDQLLERGFVMTDLRNAGLFAESGNPLFFDRILIPYYQRHRVTTLRAKHVGSNILQAKDTSLYLFGTDNLRGHSEVFICEGEWDAMLLDQLVYAACALPGALNYQEHWNWWFDDARRVFVVLDNDDAGRKGAHRIKAMLGRKARTIELPLPHGVDSTDVTDFFLRDGYTTGDFDNLVDQARGQRLYTMADAIKERDELRTKQGLTTGWDMLDRAITPGLLPGQLAVIMAKTGAGKTAMLTQLTHNLSSWQTFNGQFTGPSIPTLVLSLEQTKAEIGERLQRIGRLHNPWIKDEEFGQWYSKMLLCDENKVPAADIPLLLEEFIDDVGMAPRLMVVDYLGYWSRAFKAKSKYEQVSEAVMELKRIAKEYGIAIVAPHQVSRAGRKGERLELDFARDSGVVEETADFVLSLYKPSDAQINENDEQTWMDKAAIRMEILKSRHGSVGRVLTLNWAPYSLAMVERDGDPIINRRVEKEWQCLDMQMLYDYVAHVHVGTKFVH